MTFADIQTRIYELTHTNSTELSTTRLTTYTKPAQQRVAALIYTADGRWQWDDANQSDLPIVTTTLTASQQDYSLPITYLRITRVEIKDTGGAWHVLDPYDQDDETMPLSTLLTPTGIPDRYDLQANSVFLYPPPNYTQAASLKFWLERGPLEFDYVAGTFSDSTGSTASSPGFSPLYHDLIALIAARDYALAYSRSNYPALVNEVAKQEKALQLEYGLRNKNDRPRMSMAAVNYL